MSEKVLFTEIQSTVHFLIAEPTVDESGRSVEVVESRLLPRGEYVPLSEVPSYVREAAVAGKIPHVFVLTENQAKQRSSNIRFQDHGEEETPQEEVNDEEVSLVNDVTVK